MNLETIVLSHHDPVSLLRFQSGKTNAISPLFVHELAKTLDLLEAQDSVHAVALTGGDSRFFSFGLDVGTLLELDRKRMGEFLDDFTRMLRHLYLFPKPVVMGVNGHAMGGGLLLAITADLRVAADGDFKIGLPEIDLALAAPADSVRILARQIGHARAKALSLSGSFHSPVGARDLGLVDEVVPGERLEARVLEHATMMASRPSRAFHTYERYLTVGVFPDHAEQQRREREDWLDLWFHEDAQHRLKKLVERR